MLYVSTLTDRTTIYLDPLVKDFIQHKAVADNSSVSKVINDYFADMLEDLNDVKTIQKRRGEATVSFEDVLKEAGLDYADLRG